MICDSNASPDTLEAVTQRRATNAAMLGATDLAALAAPVIGYMVHDAAAHVRQALLAMTLRVGAAAYVRQNEAVIARHDLRPVLATIAVPTIVAVGANDLMTAVACAREISDAIPAATLHIIPACGHLPPIEQPHVVADLIRQ